MLPVSSCIDWYLTVILTLRAWAVWNRNRSLSIILPIIYSLCWGASLVITVRFTDFSKCKWNLHAHFLWMIYFMVVGTPPYPGYKGCFVTSSGQYVVFPWALLLVWDACKCKCIIKSPSHWLKWQYCWSSCWYLPSEHVSDPGFEDQFNNASHILDSRPWWWLHLPNSSGVSWRWVFFYVVDDGAAEFERSYYLLSISLWWVLVLGMDELLPYDAYQSSHASISS